MNNWDLLHGSGSFLEEMAPGTSESGRMCPFCNGGRGRERSLSVTYRLDGVLLWLCHRASCGARGRSDGNGVVTSEIPKKGFEPRIFGRETYPISTVQLNVLNEYYDIQTSDINRFGLSIERPAPDIWRLVCQISAQDGTFIGYESRRIFQNDSLPKTLHYREKDYPWMGWFYWPNIKMDKVIVVEDAISAIRASAFMPAVALMGTNFTIEKLMEIVKVTDRVILALDKDATQKAWDYKKKYGFLCPDMRVLPLEKDLKYLSHKEIKEKIAGVDYDT